MNETAREIDLYFQQGKLIFIFRFAIRTFGLEQYSSNLRKFAIV